jgi:hypothetical protein
MLMSQKLGQRLADECQSAQQLAYAEELKKNPLPSILEALPKPAAPASAPEAAGQPAPAASAAAAPAVAAPATPASGAK